MYVHISVSRVEAHRVGFSIAKFVYEMNKLEKGRLGHDAVLSAMVLMVVWYVWVLLPSGFQTSSNPDEGTIIILQ